MTNNLWSNEALHRVKAETQNALDLAHEAAGHLRGAGVPGWEGQTARAADTALAEALAATQNSAAELAEAMLLAAEVQQTWLLTRLSGGGVGYG